MKECIGRRYWAFGLGLLWLCGLESCKLLGAFGGWWCFDVWAWPIRIVGDFSWGRMWIHQSASTKLASNCSHKNHFGFEANLGFLASFVSAVLGCPRWHRRCRFAKIRIYIYTMYIDIYIPTCTSLWWITWMCLKITEPIPSQLLGNDGSGIYGPSLDRIEVILYYGATLKNAATKFARAQQGR